MQDSNSDLFDSIYNDPATVKETSLPSLGACWGELPGLEPSLRSSIEVSTSNLYMTSIQTQIFQSIRPESMLYTIISHPSSGKTQGLLILAINKLLPSIGNKMIKAVWITSSKLKEIGLIRMAKGLHDGMLVSSDTYNQKIPDLYVMSLEREDSKKRHTLAVQAQVNSIEMLVIDDADIVLSSKSNREFIGKNVIGPLFIMRKAPPLTFIAMQSGSEPALRFAQELELNAQRKQIYLNLSRISFDFDPFPCVPQYLLVSDTSLALSRIFLNYRLPLYRNAIIFVNDNSTRTAVSSFLDANFISYSIFQHAAGEDDYKLSKKLNSYYSYIDKVMIVVGALPSTIPLDGVGCVVQIGLPMTKHVMDTNLYREKVLRAFSPCYIGYSVIVVSAHEVSTVRSIEGPLSIRLIDYPN